MPLPEPLFYETVMARIAAAYDKDPQSASMTITLTLDEFDDMARQHLAVKDRVSFLEGLLTRIRSARYERYRENMIEGKGWRPAYPALLVDEVLAQFDPDFVASVKPAPNSTSAWSDTMTVQLEPDPHRWRLCLATDEDNNWQASEICEVVAHYKHGNYLGQPYLVHPNEYRRLEPAINFYWRSWTLDGIPGFEETP